MQTESELSTPRAWSAAAAFTRVTRSTLFAARCGRQMSQAQVLAWKVGILTLSDGWTTVWRSRQDMQIGVRLQRRNGWLVLTPEELLSRECVRDLVARYNLYGDTGRLDDVVQLFLPDAVFELRDGESVQRADGHDQIADLLASVRDLFQAEAEQAGTSGRIFHGVSTHVIDAVDADHLCGHAYVLLVRSGGLSEWGRYRDEYRRSDSGWRFASRIVVREGALPGPAEQGSESGE